MSAIGADHLAAIRQRAESAKEIGAVSVAWSQDIPFLLTQWNTRESALRALVAQWRADANIHESAAILEDAADQLERLLSGPQP